MPYCPWPMGADERIEEFDTWSRGRGLVARDVDRKRIVKELFDIAGPGPISKDHIDALVKRYREGLVGAHKVLLARRVGEEVLSWQDESGGPSAVPPAGGVGEEADFSEALRDLVSDRPKSRPPTAAEKHSSRPPDPLSWKPPPERGSARPVERTSARPPPKADAVELGFDEFPEPPPIPGRLGLDTSKDELASSFDGEEEEWRAPRRGLSDRPERSEGSDRPAAREPSVRPKESARPKPSARPLDLAGDAFALDDEPKRFQAGRSKPPSTRPPPGASSLPDVEADARGVDPERRRRNEDLTDSIAPPPVAPAAYPIGEITTERKFSLDDYVSTKLLIGAGGALLIIAVMTALIVRPTFLGFGDHHAAVQGTYVSKELGASIDFRDQWFHAEDLDDTETKNGWARHVALFYRGGSDYHSASAQLLFVIFDSEKAIATAEDALQLGGNETLNMAQRRKCEPFDFEGKKGTQCFAMTGQMGRTFGVVETYYADSGKVVFSRALIEMPSLGMAPGGDPEQMAQQQASFERELINAYVEIEKVVFSLKILAKR